MRNKKALLSSLVLLSLIMGGARADNEDAPINGIRHRNETTENYKSMTHVSMAGGLEFFIDGKGFDDLASMNQVQMATMQGDAAILIGKPLNINDQIQSNIDTGKLAYTMPSISEMMNNAPIDVINTHYIANSDENLKFRLKVSNKVEATDSSCPKEIESKCEVHYNMRYTPQLLDTSPNEVYFDQQINFMFNAMYTNHKSVLSADMDPVVHLKIDGTRCDSEGFFDYETRLPEFSVGALKTRAGDQHPGNGVPEARFRVGNALHRDSAKHCNFKGDDCWYVKTHPKIDSISATEGYTTGGQTLTINGWGLKGAKLADVSVLVDGVACTVLTSGLDKITCKTGAAGAVSFTGDQPGSPGLRQKVYNPTKTSENPSWSSYSNGTPVQETKLLTSWDDSYSNYTRAFTHAKGWFKAPETGKYRFYLACDDFCKTKISTTKFDKAKVDAYAMTQTNIRSWAIGWREYNHPQLTGDPNTWVSAWISLEKDQFYKVEGHHGEYTSKDHSTTSVEFEQASTAGKHQATPETQMLEVKNELVQEQFNCTVKNAMGGSFQFRFMNPKYDPTDKHSVRYVDSRAIKDNDNTNNWRYAIRDFYLNHRIWGSDVTVTKYSVNDKFETVAKSADATMTVYNVLVKRSIADVGFTSASIIKPKATTSEIVVNVPHIKSTPPFSGNFVIACANKDGNEFVSREFDYRWSTDYISMYLQWDIPHLQFKIKVQQVGTEYRENRLAFMIVFQDLHVDPAQCQIRSGTKIPLTGGANLKYVNTTPRAYGANLMFEPVPLEMLYHDATKPQVLVTVNKIDGLCPNFNCDYVYGTAPSEITAQALANGKDITITGTKLPTKDIKVVLGNTECGTITASETEITCSLVVLPAAGTWNVELYEPKGLVPVKAETAKISVALVVTSISPATNLNQLGGDELTIVGTGFDKNMDKVAIKFSDTTKCDLTSSTATTIKCIVSGFDKSAIKTDAPYATTITVNSIANAEKGVNIKSTKQSGQTLTPNSASPVLATVLTVTLQSDYTGAMTKAEDFTAKLIKDGDATVTRPLYVKSVDAATKKVVIKFPGAESGIYYIALEGKGVGRIDQTPLKLKVEGRVTGVTPLKGSYLGGTLVTITGVNFSTNKLDNPVKVGPYWCIVQTSTVSQITCRVSETKASKTSTGKVSTFLRTSEEAVTDISTTYEFSTPAAAYTSLAVAFDAATNTQVITLAGTGFTLEHAKIELWIDGKKQTSISSTATEAKFTIIDVDSDIKNKVNIYFPDGYPLGYTDNSPLLLAANMVSISPASGSAGGTLLTVTGTGFGKKSTGITLVDSTDKDVCEKVEITGYGTFTCLTKPGEILKSNKLKLKTSKATSVCANKVATACDFQQLTVGSPTVTGVTVTGSTTVGIAGTGFPTSGYTATAIIKGVESTSVVITDATALVATFANGVPFSAAASAPIIRFAPSSRRMLAGSVNYLQAAGSAKVTNAVVVSASTAGLECSFQGGCTYEVTSNGLMSSIKASTANQIDVCGRSCVMDEAKSNASKVVCTLPLVATTYSTKNYEVTKSGTLHDGTWSGTATAAELKKLVDGKNIVDMTDATATNCYVQVAYKTAHVGVLDEAKFFVNSLLDKTPFIGLKFQGSNDGSTFVDLWTVDKQVHEGWNSKDFAKNALPAYNIYRFQGTKKGSCRIGEIRLNGSESIADNNPTYSCTPKLIIDGVSSNLSAITFKNTKTPKLTAMSTRFGSVIGGESVTFTGELFSDSALTKVTIDDRVCAVTAQTSTTVTCTTANKPYKPDTPKLVINIAGFGNVATMAHSFLYVSLWSLPSTWGNDLPPQDGEAVQVPKGQHLLFNIDKGPKLSFLNVEGSLIFPPDANAQHVRTFDAHYLLVKGGYMEVGTELNRYTSKMVITMWSTKYDPNIPIFGNKVIGVNYGTLDMHGVNRPITWTDLKSTAALGATSITLNDMKNGASLDWKVGEEIVIAPTTFSGRDAEQRTIKTITAIDSNPVITFDGPLLTKHYAGVQTFGKGTANEDSIEMRAEVGLLTRNVVYRGDPVHSPDNQYGAVIICHSPGDESTTCRIDSIELTLVGQAFILGSYPIHFHQIGTVHSSYVRNNAIHHSFNRAVTIHGVHYLRVQNNVAYHTMGHTIFIEDAVETKNLIENNLILDVRRSWSLLNTDQTPASIWITNPDNIIRGNHAGGSDRYSYWYDLQVTAIGPSFDANVCPENQKLGEFNNNVAHSNGRYGLRIFHNHIPRTNQCDPINYDESSASYNPPIPAQYKNLVSYKNKRNGAIIERAGAIEWHNFKTADNFETGMEMSRTDDNKKGGYAKIIGGLVIGKSENTEISLDIRSPVGVVTPRTEYFSMKGTKFYNFNWKDAAAFHTCSHCWHDNNTDSGGRTITVEDLYIDATTVQKIVRYTTPFQTIFFDKTGSMTGKGANSWFLPMNKHLLVGTCTQEDAKGGITCDKTNQARRIAIHGMPTNFFGMRLKIVPITAAKELEMTTAKTLQAFLDAEANYGIVPFKEKKDPASAWAMPFITGHRYRLHWEAGLDFDKMKIEISEMWEADDKNVNLVFNFTEKREAINITSNYGGSGSVLIANNTLTTLSEYKSGDFMMRNSTTIKEWEMVINGKDKTRQNLLVKPLECIEGVCKVAAIEETNIPTKSSPWSDKATWGGVLPVDGDDVVIGPTMWVELDLAETPKLARLEVNGRLSFKDHADLPKIHLKSYGIWVRAGEFLIGTKAKPFSQTAIVEMLGHTESDTLTLGGTIKAGNKVLVSSAMVEMYGKARKRMSRMTEEVLAGATVIKVDATDLDWVVGDQIFLATSTMNNTHSEYRKITAITGGAITLDKKLAYYHYGAAASTGTLYNGVDIRNEVILLTRNINVRGEAKDNWPGHVLVTDIIESNGAFRVGYMIADNIEFSNLSQKDVGRGAFRFEAAVGNDKTYSKISNSAIHSGQDWGLSVQGSNNVELIDNAFCGWRAIGVAIDKSRNVTFSGNFVGDVMPRGIAFTGMTIDKEGCVTIGSYGNTATGTTNHDIKVINNIAAGCVFAGFIAPSYVECGTQGSTFKGNVAHSSNMVGIYAYANPVGTKNAACVEISHFSAYKTQEACAVSYIPTKLHKAHHITCIDVQQGLALGTGGGENDQVEIIIEDSYFFGESGSKDCPTPEQCHCQPKFAFMTTQNMNDAKNLMPTAASALPISTSHGEGNWGGKTTCNRCNFKNFIGKSMCGENSVIFQGNPMGSDKIPPHFFNNAVFTNVDETGWAYFHKPPTKWANVKDCGNFPCTAPNNVIFSFVGTKFEGDTRPKKTPADFVIVPDDATVGGTYPGCTHYKAQQIYVCELNNIGMLMFENLDTDAWDRAIQPIFLKNEETGFNNTLNAMMDHIWDTFYTGQRRMARFPAALLTGQDYDLEFSGTPPQKIRFGLEARTGGTKIRIPYPVAGSYSVSVADKNKVYQRVDNNAWDDKIAKQAALVKTKGCGENRFVGVLNFLEFWLEPGCDLLVQPKDSIQAKVRMDWTMDEFFAEGGTTRFVDRLATSLGVPSHRIKVVSIYTGSVVVDFAIEKEPVVTVGLSAEAIKAKEAEATAALASVKSVLVVQAKSGTLNVGAPVMGLEAKSESGQPELLAGDPIPAAPSKNPDVSSLVPTSGALDLACAWIALLAVAFNLM